MFTLWSRRKDCLAVAYVKGEEKVMGKEKNKKTSSTKRQKSLASSTTPGSSTPSGLTAELPGPSTSAMEVPSSSQESAEVVVANEPGGVIENIKEIFCDHLRVMVSQNRRRLQVDGFNLDLTYITDRIIAMGYPADETEALYRNSMRRTIQFLESRHSNHYKVFNLFPSLWVVKNGLTMMTLAGMFGVTKAGISQFLKRQKAQDGSTNSQRTGRPRVTDRNDDRNILKTSRTNPRLTAPAIRREVFLNSPSPPSVSTVKRRLNAAGIMGRRPVKKPLISEKNRVARVKWAKEHLNWTRQDWNKIL
ncbi:unnamed protein product [Caenorhabditis auriculariae]|uniref:Phosphatase tensin-type domain-containing protein n=1 Tax=Caenorhabditis auriculariae TaxID=2777116 RepID=A0A8S1HRQ4_9PELO|nr:unnamed protein product [Caenorhabditis auriculariae]